MVLLFFGDHAETAAQDIRLDPFAILSDHEPTHGAAIGRLADDPKAQVIARHDYSAGRLITRGWARAQETLSPNINATAATKATSRSGNCMAHSSLGSSIGGR